MDFDAVASIPDIDSRIAALAAPNGDAVANWQLRAVDIDRGHVARRVAAGRMRRVDANVFLYGPATSRPISDRTRRGIAIVHAGVGLAALARGTASAVHGVLDRGDGTIHVVVDHHVRDLPLHRIVYHRGERLDGDIVLVDGESTTSMTRTLLDLGHDHTSHQIARAMCAARDRDRLDLAAIVSRLQATEGSRGTASVAHAIALVREGCSGTRGRAEDVLLGGVLGSAVLPVPDVCNRTRFAVGGIEPDLAWNDVGLAVFADGRPHHWVDVAEKDRQEMQLLDRYGITVVRVHNWRIWNELPAVVREIEMAYLACVERGWWRIPWLVSPA